MPLQFANLTPTIGGFGLSSLCFLLALRCFLRCFVRRGKYNVAQPVLEVGMFRILPTQSEDSWLSGPGPGTYPARKIRSMVSSSRHPMNSAPGVLQLQGSQYPWGAGVAAGLGVGELAGNGVVAALGSGVAVRISCGVTVGSDAGVVGLRSDAAVSVGAGTVASAPPGVGVCSPQASRAARITRIAHTAASVLLPLIRALTT